MLSVSELLGFGKSKMDDFSKQPVVVVSRGGKTFGLMVDRIGDILRTASKIDVSLTDRPGIAGGLVYKGEVFTLIDTNQVIDKHLMGEGFLPGGFTQPVAVNMSHSL